MDFLERFFFFLELDLDLIRSIDKAMAVSATGIKIKPNLSQEDTNLGDYKIHSNHQNMQKAT